MNEHELNEIRKTRTFIDCIETAAKLSLEIYSNFNKINYDEFNAAGYQKLKTAMLSLSAGMATMQMQMDSFTEHFAHEGR